MRRRWNYCESCGRRTLRGFSERLGHLWCDLCCSTLRHLVDSALTPVASGAAPYEEETNG